MKFNKCGHCLKTASQCWIYCRWEYFAGLFGNELNDFADLRLHNSGIFP